MRVALITTEYITEEYFGGGLAHYLARLARTLTSYGHEVEIFTRSTENGTVLDEEVLVHRVRGRIGAIAARALTGAIMPRTIRALDVARRLRGRFLRRHREQPFDVIQAPNCGGCALGLVTERAVPIVTRLSCYEPLWRKASRLRRTWDQVMIERLEVAAMRRSTRVYAPSRFVAEVVRRETGINVDVLEPPFAGWANGPADAGLGEALEAGTYFLFIGQIGFLKGVAVLAESLPIVLKALPRARMVFAGHVDRGPGRVSMLEHVRRRAGAARERIHYLGMLPQPELRAVVSRANVVVLPSLVDNLPNACLEAMAAGRVVIGTQGASFEEVIRHEVSGYLTPVGDAERLARAMLTAWEAEEGRRDELGQAARSRIDLLAPRYTYPKLERYLAGAIETSG
jgi:glycosyltransferase involved in cell wall biosynthesis